MSNGIDPALRRINQFRDGDELSRQLSQLESNVGEAFGNVAQQGKPKLAPTSTKTAAYVAALDELVIAAGTFTVTIPVAAPKNAGREVGVIVKSGTVTVKSASGLVQGGATDVLPGLGAFIYESDGVGWWRHSLTLATSTTPGLVALTNDLGGTATAPTVVGLTGTAGVVAMHATTIQIDKAVASPAITHQAQTTDVATTNLTLTSQGPVAGAGTNKNPGNLVYKVPAPAAGGTDGKHSFFVSGTEAAFIGLSASSGFLTIGTNPSQSGVLRIPNNTTITARDSTNAVDVSIISVDGSNQVRIGDGTNATNTFLFSAGTVNMVIGGTGFMAVSSTYVQIGGGSNNALRWPTATTAPTIFQLVDVGGGTGQPLTVQAQNMTVTAGATGGSLHVTSGTGTSKPGNVRLRLGGTTQAEVAQLTATQRIFSLFNSGDLTTTQMPANTGDLVMYIGVAATAPTANPVGGFILYMDPADNKLKARGPSGTITTVAAP